MTTYRPVILEYSSLTLEVRRPTLRDTVEADTSDKLWWVRCVRHVGGADLTKDEALDLDAADGNTLAQEVLRPHPTPPLKSGFGD